MKKGTDAAGRLTQWGNSLLNKLSAVTRRKRKRDASKRRRRTGREQIDQELDRHD